jgi:hypothetical protein
MQIRIGLPESEKIIPAIQSLIKLFPWAAPELLETVASAKEGVLIEVVPLVPTQTNTQRGYYWKYLKAFAEYTGCTPDEMHTEMLHQAYGSELVETVMGVMRRPLKRSGEATRPEYAVLIDTLIRVAAEMDYQIPPPIRRSNREGHDQDNDT